MLILKAFGFIDFFAALTIMAIFYGVIPDQLGRNIGLFLGIYFIVKMLIFRYDIASRVDFLVGVYLILTVIFNFQNSLSVLSAIWLFQKVVFSYL